MKFINVQFPPPLPLRPKYLYVVEYSFLNIYYNVSFQRCNVNHLLIGAIPLCCNNIVVFYYRLKT
jgi:hypothetical protein